MANQSTGASSSLIVAGCAALAIGAAFNACLGGRAQAQPAAAASAAEAELRLFAVEIKTGPKWDASKPPNEQAFFRQHSENLKRLRDNGQIALGARYADKGLLVVPARSAADVRVLMDQDPSIAHGTFAFEVHEFNVFYGGSVQPRPRR